MRLFTLMLALICGAATTATALTKSEVESIVKNYIETHPADIIESVRAYELRQKTEKAEKAVSLHTPTLGPANAKVTIIEFSEFECPFCARAQGTMQKLRDRYKDDVRFAFKHLPLPFHKNAIPAAKAAQAAHRQGKFWEFSNILWKDQSRLSEKLYLKAAKDLGLDIKRFNKDRASDAIDANIETDLADGEALGVQGTPHFIINGTAISGAQPLEAFVSIIETEMKK